MHAAQDGFFVPFRSLVDGLALTQHGEVSADEIVKIAEAWGAKRATALWMRCLSPYGLAEPFRRAVERLDPRGRMQRRAAEIPRRPPEDPARRRWETRWQLATALDGPVRPVAFFAYRGAAFAADLVLRLFPAARTAA